MEVRGHPMGSVLFSHSVDRGIKLLLPTLRSDTTRWAISLALVLLLYFFELHLMEVITFICSSIQFPSEFKFWSQRNLTPVGKEACTRAHSSAFVLSAWNLAAPRLHIAENVVNRWGKSHLWELTFCSHCSLLPLHVSLPCYVLSVVFYQEPLRNFFIRDIGNRHFLRPYVCVFYLFAGLFVVLGFSPCSPGCPRIHSAD